MIDILRHIYTMYFSSIIIGDLIEYAAKKGVEIEALENEFSDLEKQKYIDYDSMVNILNFLSQELNDEYLGLHVGEQIFLKVTAQVDRIMLNSSTLEEAILNAIQYSKVISDALQCSYQKTEQYYSIIYEENPNWKIQQNFAKRQVLDITLLSNVKSLNAYSNYQYFPFRVHFSYAKPKALYEYYRLFNCSLKFGQARTEIVYERQIIDRHKKNIKQGLLESLKEKVADEIENLPVENDLVYQLKKCILNHKPQRILINEAAKELNFSKRTLQRKLKEFNTSFKAIEYELQLKLAKTYLEEGEKSLDEVSYLLGFSESSALIRFFKSLTGKTPKEYQNNFSYPQ